MAFSLSASKIELASHPRWAGADVPRSPDMVTSVRILVTLKFRFPGGIVGQKFLSVGEVSHQASATTKFQGWNRSATTTRVPQLFKLAKKKKRLPRGKKENHFISHGRKRTEVYSTRLSCSRLASMIMHDHVSTSLHTVSHTHFIWIANSTWAI